MGEIYDMTEEQIKEWQQYICVAINSFNRTRSKSVLFLVLIWVYEYIEAMTVNGIGEMAKLTRVKNRFVERADAMRVLFNLRGKLVHRVYSLEDQDISKVFGSAKEIDEVLKELGFDKPVVQYLAYLVNSEGKNDALSALGAMQFYNVFCLEEKGYSKVLNV